MVVNTDNRRVNPYFNAGIVVNNINPLELYVEIMAKSINNTGIVINNNNPLEIYVETIVKNINNVKIGNLADKYGQTFDNSSVVHTYTSKPNLTQLEHLGAILAENAYKLTNINNTNDFSEQRYMSELQKYSKNFPIHQETISNLIPLQSSQDMIYLKDMRQIVYKGETGHACFIAARGSEFHAPQTAYRDAYSDALIALGLIPRTTTQLNNSIQQALSNHPECIFNVGVGHSRAGHDLTLLNNYFDKVFTYEQGQTLWDIRRYFNAVNIGNGSNVKDFRVSCDPLSKGPGPLNGEVIHFITDKSGITACHSMQNWVENSNIIPDNISFQTPIPPDYFTQFLQQENMTPIPDGFFSSNNEDSYYVSNNLNQDNASNSNTNLDSNLDSNSDSNLNSNLNNDHDTKKPEIKSSNGSFSEADLINTLSTANKLMTNIQTISNFDNFSHREKILFIASTLIDNLKGQVIGIFNSAKDELNAFANVITSFLQDGKIKIEQIVMDICQSKFGVPLNGVRMLFESISHHGRNLKEATKSLIQDCILYCVPYAQVGLLVYQSFQILKGFLTHKSVIEVGGFSVLREEHSSFSLKRGYYHTVTLVNDILDIKVSSRNRHTKNADANAKAQFDEQAKKKAYQVYGIDYDYFNDMKDYVPETRYDKYKEILFFKLTQEYWQDINNLSEEEKKKYENAMFESNDDKTKRIKFELLGKNFSYFDINGDKDVYHFVCDLKTDFLKCKNNTERAMFLFSLFHETGHSKDDQVQFSKFTTYILELFNIDVIKFTNYINHQNDISDKDLESKIKSQKENEAKNNENHLIQLRNLRTEAQNNSLTGFGNDQKDKKQGNKDEYSLEEIRKFAHMELLKYEISAEFVFQTVSSSVTSNFLFTIVYIDKEYLRIRSEGILYAPNKIIEMTGGSIQSYVSTVLANHISLDLSLRERFLDLSDEAFQNLISPNVLLLTSLGVSSLLKLTDKNAKTNNLGKNIFEITENVLKTNGVNVINYYKAFDTDLVGNLVDSADTYFKSHIPNYTAFQDSTIAFMKYCGVKSTLIEVLNYTLVGSSLSLTLSVMFATRFIKSLIFPEIRPKYVDFKNLKDIENKNKDTMFLINQFKNKKVSNQKKLAIKRDLQMKGILNYDKLNIEQKQITTTHSNYCGKDLVFKF